MDIQSVVYSMMQPFLLRKSMEISVPERQAHRTPAISSPPEPASYFFRQLEQVSLYHSHVRAIFVERHAVAHRFALFFILQCQRHDWVIVHAEPHVTKPFTNYAEPRDELSKRCATQLAAGPDPHCCKSPGQVRADSAEFFHRKIFEHTCHVFGRNQYQAVGLLHIAPQLGKKLIRPDANGTRQTGLVPDSFFYLNGDSDGVAEERIAPGHIKKGLVDGKHLDQWSIILPYLEHPF